MKLIEIRIHEPRKEDVLAQEVFARLDYDPKQVRAFTALLLTYAEAVEEYRDAEGSELVGAVVKRTD